MPDCLSEIYPTGNTNAVELPQDGAQARDRNDSQNILGEVMNKWASHSHEAQLSYVFFACAFRLGQIIAVDSDLSHGETADFWTDVHKRATRSSVTKSRAPAVSPVFPGKETADSQRESGRWLGRPLHWPHI